jgi:hypothetical protein
MVEKQERSHKKKKRRKSSNGFFKPGSADVLASFDDGQNAGDSAQELGEMDEPV